MHSHWWWWLCTTKTWAINGNHDYCILIGFTTLSVRLFVHNYFPLAEREERQECVGARVVGACPDWRVGQVFAK